MTTTDQTPGPSGDETGRWLVALGRRPVREGLELLRGLGVAEAATSSDGPGAAAQAPALVLERLGVAVLDAPPDGVRAAGAPGALLERERFVRLPPDPFPARAAQEADLGEATWGLRALGLDPAGRRGRDGAGVPVAVLDTGVDLHHPDLTVVASTSVVPGEDAQDVQGHGTHCAGTACGPARYGVAPAARLHSAKVLDRHGRGREADVLEGLEWAVGQGCRVVSMSLSSPGGGPPSEVFEQVAAELLAEGVVLVAASGNESDRARGAVAPVGRPASCPSVLAVGAVDPSAQLAPFSNGGPELDLVGPGVDVVSAWPGGGLSSLSGTSMATPHVAGVVALVMAAHPGLSGPALLDRVRALCRPLPGPREGVGAGLVQPPEPAAC